MTEQEREAIERLSRGGHHFTIRDLAEALTGAWTVQAHNRAARLLRRLQAAGTIEPHQSEPDGTPGRPPLLWRVR